MRISDAYQQARLNGRASRDDEIDSIREPAPLLRQPFYRGLMLGLMLSGLLWGIIFWAVL